MYYTYFVLVFLLLLGCYFVLILAFNTNYMVINLMQNVLNPMLVFSYYTDLKRFLGDG